MEYLALPMGITIVVDIDASLSVRCDVLTPNYLEEGYLMCAKEDHRFVMELSKK